MSLNIITAPAYQPLTVDEAKEHLRITSTDEDSYISSLVIMATEFIQNMTARQLITATYEMTLQTVPITNMVKLPKGKLQSVTSIKYLDKDSVEQTFTDFYVLGNDPGTVYFNSTMSVEPLTADVIKIRFVCGYGSGEDVPEIIKVAMKLLIGQFYKNREATVSGSVINLPTGLDRLIEQYRMVGFY